MNRDDSVTQQLHDAETIIQDYKVKQNIAGDSWEVYRTVTPGNDYDIWLTGTMVNSSFKKRWKATYQIEGGKTIPNAFCIWYTVFYGTRPVSGGGSMNTGFNWNDEDDGQDPLSTYIFLAAGYNFTADANSYVGVKFRCISPYKGTIKFEEVN